MTAAQLYAEISQLNLNLPARVCVPLYGSRHQVLRIPGSEAVVLNSKSKVYICTIPPISTVYTCHVRTHLQCTWRQMSIHACTHEQSVIIQY